MTLHAHQRTYHCIIVLRQPRSFSLYWRNFGMVGAGIRCTTVMGSSPFRDLLGQPHSILIGKSEDWPDLCDIVILRLPNHLEVMSPYGSVFAGFQLARKRVSCHQTSTYLQASVLNCYHAHEGRYWHPSSQSLQWASQIWAYSISCRDVVLYLPSCVLLLSRDNMQLACEVAVQLLLWEPCFGVEVER